MHERRAYSRSSISLPRVTVETQTHPINMALSSYSAIVSDTETWKLFLNSHDAAVGAGDPINLCPPTSLRLIDKRHLPSLYKILYCLMHDTKP